MQINAINCMCCLRLLETPRQAGHASTSTSLDMASKAKAYTADACLESFVSSCWYFCVCAFWLKQFRRHWPLSLFQQLQKLCCACYRAQSSLLACVFVPPTQAPPPNLNEKSIYKLSATPAPQPPCWWLATTPRSDSTLQYIAIPHKTVPTSNGCPLQQWTEGQPLPVQSIHERWRFNELFSVTLSTFKAKH